MPERESKTSMVPVVWATFGIFSVRFKWFPVVIGDHGRNLVVSLWPRDKATVEWWHSGSPHPKKFWVQKSVGKVLASIFWDQNDIPLIDYLPTSQTINAEYYSSLLVQLKDILKEKRCGKVTEGVLFLHDNAPAHWALATQKQLASLGFQCLDHPPYSPDLALSDYHLFPGLKKQLKGRHFSSNVEVIAAAETWLDGQPSEFFFEWLAKVRATGYEVYRALWGACWIKL